MLSKNIEGKNITIIGAARSGVAVAQLLQNSGAKIFVSELNDEKQFIESKRIFKNNNIDFEFGKHSNKIFDSSLFVISPGIPTNSPIVSEAIKRRIPVISELECAFWFCKSPVTAITGSAGKTTTTTLLGRMASDAKKKHFVAGNIGIPLSSFVSNSNKETIAIVEVSSFQLDFCQEFHPKISVLTNITQNHLDRYENKIENYAKSKSKIFSNQTESDFLIYNFDDQWSKNILNKNLKVNLIPFSTETNLSNGAYIENNKIMLNLNGYCEEVIEIEKMSLKGKHNIYNSMAATIAAKLNGISTPSIRATLKNFKGVEHRQEFVAEINGVKFINDSKSTTADSVKYAIDAISSPVILILGGKDKGNDYSQIEKQVKEKVKLIIAIGVSSEKIYNHFKNLTNVLQIETTNTEIPNLKDLKNTLNTAIENSVSGDVVLFSPGCASFDWFNDYEDRGNSFKKIILQK